MRVQSNRAIAYMFRNFFPLLFFAIVPAVLLGLFAGNEGALRFLNAAAEWWNQGGVIAEVTVGKEMLFDFTIVRIANVEGLIVLVGFVLYVFSTGFILATVERHMRLGVRFSRGAIRNAFSVMGRVALFILLLVAINELSMMMIVGLVSIMEEIGATMRFVIVFAMALLVLAKILFCSIVGLLLCSLPVSQCDDYKLNVAMSYSARLMGKRNDIVLALVMLFLFSKALTFTVAYLLSPLNLDFIAYCLYYLFWIMYLPCLAVKVYFDVAGEPRKDLEKQIF